jgi:hypothetical protein
MYWASVIAIVMAAICLGITGFRNSAWYGAKQKLFDKLNPIDMKLAKIAALFFVAGILFFCIGTTVR